MRRRTALVGLTFVAAIASGGPEPAPASAAGTATVRVDANAFAPKEVAVNPSGTVTWLVQEGGHTIAADDGRFHFRGTSGTTLPAGTTVSFTFTTANERVGYYCEIHGGAGGQGMAGRIQVGTPPEPPPYLQPVIRVPGDASTLAAAVAIAAPGHRVELGPGDHPVTKPVTIDVDKVTISGADSTTRLVPKVGGDGFPTTALIISSSHTRVERLRIGAFRWSGIQFDGANAAEIVDVHVDGRGFGLDGIAITAANGVTVRDSTTTGNRRAGIRATGCAACGLLIEGTRSFANDVGLLLESARGITVRESTLDANATGVSAMAVRSTSPLRPVVLNLRDNVITGNLRAGVRLSGVADTFVAGNTVTGSTVGISVAGDWSARTVIQANTVEGSLTWDGLGVDVEFVANRDSAGNPKSPQLDPTASLQ